MILNCSPQRRSGHEDENLIACHQGASCLAGISKFVNSNLQLLRILCVYAVQTGFLA